jgi:flagellar basal-body rod protein FlgB
MSGMPIFNQTFGLLKKVLDLRQQNQQLITTNIANAETPGYVPARLDFEKGLQQALAAQAPVPAARDASVNQALDRVEGTVVRLPGNGAIGDNNRVEVDQEMVSLAENEIMYEAAVSMMTKKLAMLKYVASDGR